MLEVLGIMGFVRVRGSRLQALMKVLGSRLSCLEHRWVVRILGFWLWCIAI